MAVLGTVGALLPVAAASGAAGPQPRFAHTVALAPVKGSVLVKQPRSGSQRLTGATLVKVGSTVDTTNGKVKLTSTLPGGKTQFGTFNGGEFVVTQARRAAGLTDLTLAGVNLQKCSTPSPAAGRAAPATAAASPRSHLFGHAHGHFRTRGRNSTATVRGTTWLTEDRCDGTHTTDIQGKVDTRTTDGLELKLYPGQVVTYYCSPRTHPLAPGTYCVNLLATPKFGLISSGIIDITTETQYDLCVTGPDDGQEHCETDPLSDPVINGFRESAVTCFTHRGTGIHTVRWRVGGVFLYPPLSVYLVDLGQPTPDCIRYPKPRTRIFG